MIKARLRRERTQFLIDYFTEHPCADCGETDALVLEFDHLRDKKFDIAVNLITVGMKTLLEEIVKCEVVCANCHRRRTFRRAGSATRRRVIESGRPDLNRHQKLGRLSCNLYTTPAGERDSRRAAGE